MNFKRYHVSKNLCLVSQSNSITYDTFNNYTISNNTVTSTGQALLGFKCKVEPNTSYTISIKKNTSADLRIREYNSEPTDWATNFVIQSLNTTQTTAVITTTQNTTWILVAFWFSAGGHTVYDIMLNEGSTPQPYEPYSSEVWHDIPYYIHNTSTDTITTLPADIYANDTSVTVGLKGNMEQSGTPSPSSIIMPQECGDLETTGEHTGQYKIPISSNNTTTPVYLGEVETTRRVKKLVLTGEETSWNEPVAGIHRLTLEGYMRENTNIPLCTHYIGIAPVSAAGDMGNLRIAFLISASGNNYMYIRDSAYTSIANFKSYLAAQYAAGTPVTVWYVLANEETGIVNEPLMKIGDYADEVSGITIPTIAGANTIDVDTTLKPSEVSVNYHGWHPVQSVHERENGAWD